MPILSKFVYTWPDGTTPIMFVDWADIRQKEFRKQVVDQGNLKVTNDGYVWKDKDTLNTGKPTDPTWQMYWNQWIDKTGVQFTIEQTEI